jgi:glucose-6-phosphate 1-epimerase
LVCGCAFNVGLVNCVTIMSHSIESLRRHEISGRVAIVAGNGGLPKLVVTAKSSTAEIYLHGAHVTHFQKKSEPPLIFVSAKSFFAPGKAIRGGIPICYPWFGNRDGGPSHGFARITEWELVQTSATPEGAVKIHLALPKISGSSEWNNLRTEFTVTIADTLTMELETTNESCDSAVEFEECLHTYLHVGSIGMVSITGLEKAPFDDFALGANGARRDAENSILRISQETNRVYFDSTQTVEVRDERLKRVIRVEKFNSKSTVVWNPWTTQKMPEDWAVNDCADMVCVESANVKQNKISLPAGKATALKVVLTSSPLK